MKKKIVQLEKKIIKIFYFIRLEFKTLAILFFNNCNSIFEVILKNIQKIKHLM